jgi:hypothetical protein
LFGVFGDERSQAGQIIFRQIRVVDDKVNARPKDAFPI